MGGGTPDAAVHKTDLPRLAKVVLAGAATSLLLAACGDEAPRPPVVAPQGVPQGAPIAQEVFSQQHISQLAEQDYRDALNAFSEGIPPAVAIGSTFLTPNLRGSFARLRTNPDAGFLVGKTSMADMINSAYGEYARSTKEPLPRVRAAQRLLHVIVGEAADAASVYVPLESAVHNVELDAVMAGIIGNETFLKTLDPNVLTPAQRGFLEKTNTRNWRLVEQRSISGAKTFIRKSIVFEMTFLGEQVTDPKGNPRSKPVHKAYVFGTAASIETGGNSGNSLVTTSYVVNVEDLIKHNKTSLSSRALTTQATTPMTKVGAEAYEVTLLKDRNSPMVNPAKLDTALNQARATGNAIVDELRAGSPNAFSIANYVIELQPNQKRIFSELIRSRIASALALLKDPSKFDNSGLPPKSPAQPDEKKPNAPTFQAVCEMNDPKRPSALGGMVFIYPDGTKCAIQMVLEQTPERCWLGVAPNPDPVIRKANGTGPLKDEIVLKHFSSEAVIKATASTMQEAKAEEQSLFTACGIRLKPTDFEGGIGPTGKAHPFEGAVAHVRQNTDMAILRRQQG